VIEIHVYGQLRQYASSSSGSGESVLELERRSGETVRSVLERVGIDQEEVCHVFLNGSILATQNSMAPWLEYQKAEGKGLETPVRDGDRLGLFARDMALLVV
jgi:hypothetical protein